MATPEGRAAFQTSIKDQMVSGANSTWKNISEMSISNMIDTALNSLSNAGKNISDSAKNLGKNAYEAGASAIRVMSNPLEAMQTQIAAMSKVITKFAGHNSSAELSLAESASSAKAVSTSMAERTQQLIESVGSKLMNMQPQKVVQIAAELTMSGLTVTGGVMQYNATKLKGKAQEAQAGMLDSQAQATNLNQQIQLANSQINMVLGDMNSSIVGAGNALANMSSLSSETVGHLHGAAAA